MMEKLSRGRSRSYIHDYRRAIQIEHIRDHFEHTSRTAISATIETNVIGMKGINRRRRRVAELRTGPSTYGTDDGMAWEQTVPYTQHQVQGT
jgi:hypothetical protein